ncbi:hypothetical protein F4780DRAFT_672572 [Xylariomycetidae sp. FL0641]|nr:hypothetical protein F4780DRAFT_672572 [Xylariomycetidae sp. FL0641]
MPSIWENMGKSAFLRLSFCVLLLSCHPKHSSPTTSPLTANQCPSQSTVTVPHQCLSWSSTTLGLAERDMFNGADFLVQISEILAPVEASLPIWTSDQHPYAAIHRLVKPHQPPHQPQ